MLSIYTSETLGEIPGIIHATLVTTKDGPSTITVNNGVSEQADFDDVYEACILESENGDSLPSTESKLQKSFKSATRFQWTLMAFLVILAIATVVVLTLVGILRESIGTNNGDINAIAATAMTNESSSNQTSSSDSEFRSED